MKGPLLETFGKLVGLAVTGIVVLLAGCAAPKGEGFAIYLTRGDVPPAQMPALDQVDLTETPVISLNDIVAYNAQTYELKLTANAFERVSKLEVPVTGKSFVVCVDGKPIYWGAFWTPISSLSFDGVTIWKPYTSQGPAVLRLELGYPSSSFYVGVDPRNNPEVIGSLKESGKLVTALSATTVERLPRSMKGYELYSWQEEGQWHFTLITGTNRLKTPEEITSTEGTISETGWVQVHVVGIEAIEAVLGKLPQGEEVFWGASAWLEQTSTGRASFAFPPEPMVNAIEDYAVQRGIGLRVQRPFGTYQNS